MPATPAAPATDPGADATSVVLAACLASIFTIVVFGAVWVKKVKKLKLKAQVGPTLERTFSKEIAKVPMPSTHEVSPMGVSVWHLTSVLKPAVDKAVPQLINECKSKGVDLHGEKPSARRPIINTVEEVFLNLGFTLIASTPLGVTNPLFGGGRPVHVLVVRWGWVTGECVAWPTVAGAARAVSGVWRAHRRIRIPCVTSSPLMSGLESPPSPPAC